MDNRPIMLISLLNELRDVCEKIGRWFLLARETIGEIGKTEKIEDGDLLVWLFLAPLLDSLRESDDSKSILRLVVSKYYLHERSLQYFEREQVEQQLKREDILSIASSAVLIWMFTKHDELHSLELSAYFSLPQEKREKMMASVISRECRRELLGEITDPRRKVSLEEIEYRLGVCNAEPEDTSLDLSRLGLDIDTLTKGEIALLYDVLNATNQGVEVGSKQGYSLRQYWGKDYTKNMKMRERLKAKRQKT